MFKRYEKLKEKGKWGSEWEAGLNNGSGYNSGYSSGYSGSSYSTMTTGAIYDVFNTYKPYSFPYPATGSVSVDVTGTNVSVYAVVDANGGGIHSSEVKQIMYNYVRKCADICASKGTPVDCRINFEIRGGKYN